MTAPNRDADTRASSRDVLHRLATHVLARRQHQVTALIDLRPAPGGFATTGIPGERLRISGTLLVREHQHGEDSGVDAVQVSGATLRNLAAFAGVDLGADFTVGPATPQVGDVDAPLPLDLEASNLMAGWYGVTAQALDRVVDLTAPWSTPTLPRLWPEHFDLAIDLGVGRAEAGERRANVGGSPGDGFHDEPYLYVGPWDADRPGDPAFWNAPFGAVLDHRAVMASPDPVRAATSFFLEGLGRLQH